MMKAYAEYLKGNARKGLRFMLLPSKDTKELRDYLSAEDVGKFVNQLNKVGVVIGQ
jgi:hypothetical protein